MNMLRATSLLAAGVIFAALGGCVQHLPRDHNRLAAYQEYRQGNYDEARERFERVLDADPTDWRSHYYAGVIALEHDNEPNAARRHLSIAYEIYEGRATRRLNYEIGDPQTGVPYPTRAEILDAKAEAIYQQNHEQALHAFLRRAIQSHGTPADYMRMGRYMERIGDHDSARSAYRSAVRMVGPNDPVPYLRLADFYENIGNYGRALVELRKAYGIDPQNREANRRLRGHGVTPGPTAALAHDWEDGDGDGD